VKNGLMVSLHSRTHDRRAWQLDDRFPQLTTPTTEPRQVAPRLVGVLSCLLSVGYSVHVGQLLGTNERGHSMSNTQDHCNPQGIQRPLIVNGEPVLTCSDCSGLFTSSHGDISDITHRFQCYDCRDGATDWQKDTQGNWGQAFASALGADTAPACWDCGEAERVGDYCKACLSNQ
jgi:hypothetical protein